jgi:hypothetical protein
MTQRMRSLEFILGAGLTAIMGLGVLFSGVIEMFRPLPAFVCRKIS